MTPVAGVMVGLREGVSPVDFRILGSRICYTYLIKYCINHFIDFSGVRVCSG
jgi:hypothetical protein